MTLISHFMDGPSIRLSIGGAIGKFLLWFKLWVLGRADQVLASARLVISRTSAADMVPQRGATPAVCAVVISSTTLCRASWSKQCQARIVRHARDGPPWAWRSQQRWFIGWR